MTQNKKLNLNQPIMSVRRQHPPIIMTTSQNVDERKTDKSVAVIPRHELKAGPVKNPGTIPFHWEQTPGQPKILPSDDASHHDIKNFDEFKDAKEESKISTCDESLFVDAQSRARSVDGASGSFSWDRKSRVLSHTVECASKMKEAAFRSGKVINTRDEECDQRGDHLLAVCGLVPRFCFKSSICVLNPVPAISLRTRAILSSCNGIQSSAACSSSTHTANELYEVKPVGKFQRDESKGNKTRSKNDITVIYCGKSLSFLQEKKVLGVKGFESVQKKGSKTFQELLQGSPIINELDLGGSDIFEQTVYVDSEYEGDNKRPRQSPYILDPVKEEEEEEEEGEEKDNEIISTKRMDQMHTMYSSRKDLIKKSKNPLVDGECDWTHKSHYIKKVSSIDKSNQKLGAKTLPKVFGGNEDTILISTKSIEVAENIEKKLTSTKNIEKQLTSTSRGKYSDVVVPPPLPKSPLDSWLRRTLPSMSTRINGSFKARKDDNIKWDTTVLKSTY